MSGLQATCARHPDVAALGSCMRCGIYCCAQCAVDHVELHCSDCDALRYEARAKLDARKRRQRLMALALGMLTLSAGVVLVQFVIGILHTYAMGLAGALAVFGGAVLVGALIQPGRR
jgi:hypothetical protein